MNTIVVRPIEPAEWKLFRDFRLGALKAAPGMFGASFGESATLPDKAWRDMLESDQQAIFGVFEDDRVVGLSAALTFEGDPTGQTALVSMGFIHPAWRGRGLSHRFLDACVSWIAAQPRFRRAVVAHRASNFASRGGIVGAGFVEFLRSPRTWPDGEVEDEVIYEMRILR